MANFNSNLISATAIDPSKPTDLGGRLRLAHFTYDIDGTEAATDTVSLVKLPLNAKVFQVFFHSEEIDATDDGATTPTTIDVGDADDDDRYMASLGPNTASGASDAYGVDGADQPVLIDTENKRTIQALFDAIDNDSGEAGATLSGYVVYAID